MTTALKNNEDILLIRKEKLNKIKTAINPDYIRSVFNESKDCKAIISYENTTRPLEGRMLINRTHIKDKTEWYKEGIKVHLLEGIAKNPNTPKDVLEQLVEIGYYRIFQMSHCPEDIKQKIISLWEQLGYGARRDKK
jgi:hypothetical protein